MPITKPFHRIWRPLKGYSWLSSMWEEDRSQISLDYLKDDLFANQQEKRSLITTTRLIIHDLYTLFNYVEPNDSNLTVFSHRIYELFLRTATEVESNFKGILTANNYQAHNRGNLNISNDYFKLANILKLSEYRIIFKRWNSNKVFEPFITWNSSNYSPLPWYQSYNNVKHNRHDNFNEANLENLMNALAGLLCLLHAQFGEDMGIACFEGISTVQNDQNQVNTESFDLYAPIFPDEEQYEFIWDVIRQNEQHPVIDCPF